MTKTQLDQNVPVGTVTLQVTATELNDIGNGLGLLAASLRRAETNERDLEVREIRGKQHARVVATISRLTNLPLDI